jgi:transcriptional regulator with PAS, ATPase and Fis domain
MPIGKLMRDVMAEADVVAPTDSKVLIMGETGVGKELMAHRIHEHSLRSHLPMVTVNCAGIPETLLESELFGHVRGSFTGADRDKRGLLEAAHGGTVLLDEIGEMSLRMQTLLLRFLDSGEIQRVGGERTERPLNIRLIAATNRNLLDETRRKTFREDLYYRINVVSLVIPPLRERREDIAALMEYYLEFASRAGGVPLSCLAPAAMASLEAYWWPGNVRELRNVAERITLRNRGRPVALSDLPVELLARGHAPALPLLLPAADRSHAAVCYDQMTLDRLTFWVVVYEPFMLRDMTRDTVRELVRRGLERTHGRYGELTRLFNLPPTDYKRFLRFLQTYGCHVPFKRYRIGRPAVPVDDRLVAETAN